MTLLLTLLACGQDISVTETARCDGILQSSEEWVDQPFDKDEDGYPDAGNSECLAAYDLADLDCDDNNPDVSPSAVEVGCNLRDDDCDPDTLDEEDRDEDSYTSCEECDDFNPDVNPAAEEIVCNGLDDDCNPGTVDSEDLDQDGFSECDLDCDDTDPHINPDMVETPCNGVDDDCSETTPDGPDGDGDGSSECSDCDDDDSQNFPGNTEICDDGADNDCDTAVDESCASDYSGTWSMDTTVSVQCAEFFGVYVVDFDFDRIIVQDVNPDVYINAVGGGAQPGTMGGSFSTSTEFSTINTLSGSCTETYSVVGTFTSDTTMDAIFKAQYSGGGNACKDCTTRSWPFTATR